jgi:broad specificity phosphatase PhoE
VEHREPFGEVLPRRQPVGVDPALAQLLPVAIEEAHGPRVGSADPPMAIHLVRHADAGRRGSWHQPDDLRPLTNRGLVQAAAIADALATRPIARVVSSRYARCLQSVQPLADRLGLEVESHPALAEEASLVDTWALVEEAARDAGDVVLCSHGNVIPPVLDRLHRRGVPLDATRWSCHKGSIWTLDVDGGDLVRAVLTLERA